MDPLNGAASEDQSAGWPTVRDRWARRPLWLNGPLERSSPHAPTVSFLVGLLGLGAAFIVFQVLITPILLLLQVGLAEGGLSSLETMQDPGRLLSTYTRELVVSNSVGQVLGLAVPAIMFARLHTSRVREYLRFRSVDGRLLGLAAVGVLGLQPIVQWLVKINQNLPLPEGLRGFEESQLKLIRTVLESDFGVAFSLLMLAVVPGICEEIIFRGYAQRQFERAAGVTGGILLSGILFAGYHLRPSQVLPLAVLGCYLAYVTWRTGSLWPAILVHLLHNGIAVAVARYVEAQPAYDYESLQQAPLPGSVVVLGFVILGAVLYVLHHLAPQIRDG